MTIPQLIHQYNLPEHTRLLTCILLLGHTGPFPHWRATQGSPTLSTRGSPHIRKQHGASPIPGLTRPLEHTRFPTKPAVHEAAHRQVHNTLPPRQHEARKPMCNTRHLFHSWRSRVSGAHEASHILEHTRLTVHAHEADTAGVHETPMLEHEAVGNTRPHPYRKQSTIDISKGSHSKVYRRHTATIYKTCRNIELDRKSTQTTVTRPVTY